MNWYIDALKNYANFSGRSQRKNFWYFILFNIIISMILAGIDMAIINSGLINIGLLSAIYSLAILIPSFSITVRRLHDIGSSAWWLLIALIPIIGFIILIVAMILDSEPRDNKYGVNPKGVAA